MNASLDLATLIERVLPLERLPGPDAWRAPSPFRRAMVEPVEAVARIARTHLDRDVTTRAAGENDAVIAVEVAPHVGTGAPSLAPDVGTDAPPPGRISAITVPRAALPDAANVAPGQIRRLLRLGDPMLASDPRRGETRADLADHLERAAHEVLGAVAVRLVTPDEAGTDDMAREAQAHPDAVFCAGGGRGEVAGAAGAARAWLGLVSSGGDPLGVLHVSGLAGCGDHDLALVALLGDYAAGVLERAARVENLVFIDPMTGAYNRSYFEIQMQNEMARAERDASGMAICIVDIDDFKSFNTRFGYEGGNDVLVRVAHALRGGVRPFDTVARWGGEEFAVLLSAPVQAPDVMTVAERLRGIVERLTVPIVGLDGEIAHVRVTVSLGAALFPDHGTDPAALWRTANVALLEAKRPPKNRVVFGA